MASLPRALPAPEQKAGRPLRVLVVDDNKDAAESCAMLLQLHGHEVQVAYDGRSAVVKARLLLPKAVLLDIGLPRGMDGYEVARQLRLMPGMAQALLIAMTGYGQDEDRRRGQEAGFNHHVTKPADPAELQRLLATWTPPA
jgi:CheY-like chemotaxis protein